MPLLVTLALLTAAAPGQRAGAAPSRRPVVISASFELAGAPAADADGGTAATATAPASAGIFDAGSGVMVRQLFSGRRVAAGRHTVRVSLPAAEAPPGRQLELRVVRAPAPPTPPPAAAAAPSSSSSSRYIWEGVVGNTGPLVGVSVAAVGRRPTNCRTHLLIVCVVAGGGGVHMQPGALKGLNPPRTIQVVGDQAVWCLGYNERQPGCFVFNTSSPQISRPVS
jgi:hypothetical protein